MTLQIALVYGVLVGAIALWVSDRLRVDLVAVLALLVLSLTGVLDPGEALAGFADPVVLMIAGLFIVGEGLFQTGVAQTIGRWPARIAGESEVRLLAVIMAMVALLSAFMSSTGTVAIMLPVVMGLAWERGIAPSRLLIPLAVASLLGGMLTLIGTPPNIVVSNYLATTGRPPFRFFTFTPVGLPILLAGIGFMVLVGRHLLPERKADDGGSGPPRTSVADLTETYDLAGTLFRVRVPATSSIAGRTIEEVQVRKRFGVNVVGMNPQAPRHGHAPTELIATPPWTRFEPGDEIHLQGRPKAVADFVNAHGLDPLPDREGEAVGEGLGLVEVLLTPGSSLIGKTLETSGIREKYRVIVLAVRRMGQPLDEDLATTPLRFGDTLLVKGAWKRIAMLERERRDFVVTGVPGEMERAVRPYQRAPWALAIMAGMMLLMTFDIVPAVFAVLLAAAAMVLTGCVRGDDAYRAINWTSVVLIAAVLPMATALEKTGGMALMVEALGGALDRAGPMTLLATLFVLTSLMSQVISNTATAVLLTPLAFQLAVGIGANPEPFLMAIAIAASTAFATPIASPVNTLVLGPGGYRFGDFFKVGVALQLIVLALSLLIVPLLFPF